MERSNTWKKWTAAAAAGCVAAGLLLGGCGGTTTTAEEGLTAGQEQRPEEKPVLRVGFDGTTVPCSWAQRDDSGGAVPVAGSSEFLCGFEVEYMKTLCDEMGYEMEAYKIDWDGLMMAVSSGKIDCAAAMIAPTQDRKKTMDFSVPYYNAGTVVVTRKGGPYADAAKLEDFEGARVTSMLNTLWYGQIDQIPGVQKEAAMENVPVMLVALKAGTIDGILLDEPTARGSVAANAELVIAPLEEGEFELDQEDTAVAVAVTKGNEALVNQLNEAIGNHDQEYIDQLIESACAKAPAGSGQGE